MSQVPHTFIVDSTWLKISSFFFEIMVSHIVTSYGLQAAQANEKPPRESSLDLTPTQHPRDEKLELQEVRIHLELSPLEPGIIVFLQTPAP
jgi:hypothetical protein